MLNSLTLEEINWLASACLLHIRDRLHAGAAEAQRDQVTLERVALTMPRVRVVEPFTPDEERMYEALRAATATADGERFDSLYAALLRMDQERVPAYVCGVRLGHGQRTITLHNILGRNGETVAHELLHEARGQLNPEEENRGYDATGEAIMRRYAARHPGTVLVDAEQLEFQASLAPFLLEEVTGSTAFFSADETLAALRAHSEWLRGGLEYHLARHHETTDPDRRTEQEIRLLAARVFLNLVVGLTREDITELQRVLFVSEARMPVFTGGNAYQAHGIAAIAVSEHRAKLRLAWPRFLVDPPESAEPYLQPVRATVRELREEYFSAIK